MQRRGGAIVKETIRDCKVLSAAQKKGCFRAHSKEKKMVVVSMDGRQISQLLMFSEYGASLLAEREEARRGPGRELRNRRDEGKSLVCGLLGDGMLFLYG